MKTSTIAKIVGLLSITLFSCQKMFIDSSVVTENKKDNFDYLWTELDKKYSFFDLKGVDWKEVKVQYGRQVQEHMSDEAFFDLLASMLNELKDDHTNLVAPFNISSYDVASHYPSQIHPPLLSKLFPNLMSTGMFRHTMIDSVNIGYIRFSSFDDVTEDILDYVLNRYRSAKGIILDMRGNGGGAGVIVNMILSRFTNEEKIVGYEQMRNGDKHNDFSEPAPVVIKPKGTFFNRPMMVLIDRGCYSSATYFALSTKSFDNITLMGDTTGGGAGMPNGGELPNGWTYRFSTTRLLDKDKNNYAEQGVPPDVIATFNWNDVTKDAVIEQAILRLR